MIILALFPNKEINGEPWSSNDIFRGFRDWKDLEYLRVYGCEVHWFRKAKDRLRGINGLRGLLLGKHPHKLAFLVLDILSRKVVTCTMCHVNETSFPMRSKYWLAKPMRSDYVDDTDKMDDIDEEEVKEEVKKDSDFLNEGKGDEIIQSITFIPSMPPMPLTDRPQISHVKDQPEQAVKVEVIDEAEVVDDAAVDVDAEDMDDAVDVDVVVEDAVDVDVVVEDAVDVDVGDVAEDVELKMVTEDDDEAFEVESILNKRRDGQKVDYEVKWVGYDEPTWIPAANISAELKREFNQPAVSEIVSNISPSVTVEVMDETDEAKDEISSFDGPPVPPSENSESEIEEDFDNVEVEVLTTDNNQAFPEEVFGEAEEVNRYPTRARDPSGKAIRNAQASFVHSYVTILKMQQLEKVKALERDLKTTVHAYFNNVSEMTTMKKSEVFFTVPITKDKKGNWLYDGVPVSSIKVPKGVKAAVNSTYKEQWEGAMTEEYDALEEKGTWIPVYREGSDRPIGTIWVFCLKLDPSEQTLRFKARLVVAGQHRTCGIDHTQDEVFTNVLMMKSLRQLVALGLQHDDVEMEHWDIKNAFLEADMNKHITIHQPKGFYIHQGKVLKLLKALYGLPEAMRLFCDNGTRWKVYFATSLCR
jgi:hypothetical protein